MSIFSTVKKQHRLLSWRDTWLFCTKFLLGSVNQVSLLAYGTTLSGVANLRSACYVELLARDPLIFEDGVDVVYFAQPLEEWDEIQQLGVGHVVKPRGHGHGVVGVEDVGGRRVVEDEEPVEVSAQSPQVLDIVPPVEDARLPKEAAAERAPLVQKV